jgi:hypothetical protein
VEQIYSGSGKVVEAFVLGSGEECLSRFEGPGLQVGLSCGEQTAAATVRPDGQVGRTPEERRCRSQPTAGLCSTGRSLKFPCDIFVRAFCGLS